MSPASRVVVRPARTADVRAIRSLVDTMVIAHASTTDTVQESIGFCQWEDVRRTRKAQQFLDDWQALKTKRRA